MIFLIKMTQFKKDQKKGKINKNIWVEQPVNHRLHYNKYKNKKLFNKNKLMRRTNKEIEQRQKNYQIKNKNNQKID